MAFFLAISLVFILPAFADREYRQEISLLHKRINTDVFQRIHFSKEGITWGSNDPEKMKKEFSQYEVIFYHFWSYTCKSCVDELPAIKELMAFLYDHKVYPVYIAKDQSRGGVGEFYKVHGDLFFEKADHYFTTSSTNTDFWGVDSLPLSMLTEGRNVIGHAFVGSLTNRMKEVREVVELFAATRKSAYFFRDSPSLKRWLSSQQPTKLSAVPVALLTNSLSVNESFCRKCNNLQEP